MLPSFMTQTITRLRPGTKTDSRDSKIPDWSTATEKTIEGCSIQPASTSLTQDGRVLGISDSVTIYAPANADVQAGDRIVANGETYVINGDPRRWPSASGGLDNIQLNCERWSG